MKQVEALRAKHLCPLFIAGDLFHRWDASSHLVSWLLWTMGKGACYGVPGQHDLPNHDYKSLSRSAYYTMVMAGRVHDLPPGHTYDLGAWLMVTAFPWGFPVTPPTRSLSMMLSVALVHSYFWTAKTGHPRADPKHRYSAWVPRLKAYDFTAIGDNHQGVLVQDSKPLVQSRDNDRPPVVANCGGLQRLTTDQRAYRPRVYLLHANGTASPHYLDTSKEKWSDADPSVEKLEQATGLDLAGFVEELDKMRAAGHDFPDIVKRWLEGLGLSREVEDIILKAVNLPEGKKK